jgi:hypothetical protein
MEHASEEPKVVRWLRKHRHKPILGGLSLYAFCAALMTPYATSGYGGGPGGQGFNPFVASMPFFGLMCIPVVGFAFASLVRHERPRWLSIVGLCVGLPPALRGLYIVVAGLL